MTELGAALIAIFVLGGAMVALIFGMRRGG